LARKVKEWASSTHLSRGSAQKGALGFRGRQDNLKWPAINLERHSQGYVSAAKKRFGNIRTDEAARAVLFILI
jgi:hypothetical protein